MIDRSSVMGVVLAGGQSRRMGGEDKALRALAGRPLIGHVIDRLRPQAGSVAINANGDPARFAPFGLPVFCDTVPGHTGPLAGVLVALRFAAGNAGFTHVATAATDTPFFPLDCVARLREAAVEPETIAMARSGGHRHPVFALWPIALADDLENWLSQTDTYKVMAWVRRHRLAEVDFEDDRRDPFFNVNTPDDLAAAERHLRAEATP